VKKQYSEKIIKMFPQGSDEGNICKAKSDRGYWAEKYYLDKFIGPNNEEYPIVKIYKEQVQALLGEWVRKSDELLEKYRQAVK
jgi:hypothetical protein